MAAFMFNNAKNGAWGAPDAHSVIDYDTDAIDAWLIDESDIGGGVVATLQDYDDISAGVVATKTDLTVTVGSPTDGAVDITDFDFTSVTGDACDVMVIGKDSGVTSTSPLAVCWDSASDGLPVTPNGGDISVAFHASGAFSF